MSNVPSAEQISDLRADVGDEAGTAFTDDEITRIWARVSGAESEVIQHEAALALMFRQLMSNAAKFADYTAGDTDEKRSQVFKHLKTMYSLYADRLEDVLGTETRQFSKRAVRGKPRQNRNEPGDFSGRNQTRIIPRD